jgi:hypothetical protein
MALYLSKGKVINELDPPVMTHLTPKSVTVNVRTGSAIVFLGPISGQSITLVAGESMNWSTLSSSDFVEQMTVTAIGAGASVLVAWSHF